MAKNNKPVVLAEDDDEAPVAVTKKQPAPVVAPPAEELVEGGSDEQAAPAPAEKPAKRVSAPVKDPEGTRIQMLRTLEPGPVVGKWSAAAQNIAAMKQGHQYIVPGHVADDLVSKGHAIATA